MEKPTSAADSGGMTTYYTVFIDTSLDTHLAMIVSDSDTVCDLKKKIMEEHPSCFPNIGGINIHALKVKRKGYFYHLSDSMTVKSAFHGVTKNWFLSVDASSVEEQGENRHRGKPNTGEVVASLGIMSYPSVDRDNLLLCGPARNLSSVDDSSLPQVQKDETAKQKPAADNNTGNNCKTLLLETQDMSDPQLLEKHDLDGNEQEDPLRYDERMEESSRNVTDNAPSIVSLERSSKTGLKKRHQTKMRSKGEVHDHALEEDNAMTHVSDKIASQQCNVIPENSLIDKDRARAVAHNMEIGSRDDVHESGKISTSDPNKRPENKKQTMDIVSDRTVVPEEKSEHDKRNSENALVKVHCNTLLKEASPGRTVKKKQKIVRKDDNENSSKDNKLLTCDSTKGTSEPGIIISHPLVDKQTDANAALERVSTEVLKGDHLLTTSPGSGKKKRKRKRESSKSVGQTIEAKVPSYTDNNKEQSSLDKVEVTNSLGREAHPAVIPENSVQDAMVSDFMEENPCVLVQEVEESNKVTCSSDVDNNASDAVKAKSKNSSPALQRVRASEDLQGIAKEGNSPLVVQEANNLDEDMGVSKNENVIVNDNQKFGHDQSVKVAEQRELSQNNDSKEMPSNGINSDRNEINMNSNMIVSSDLFTPKENVEPGKSLKKRKKSKRTRDPVASDREQTGMSYAEPREPANKDHSRDKSRKEESILSPVMGKEVSKTTVNTTILATDRETDNVIRNVLESLRDISKDQVNAKNKDEKLRKKTKRNQDSAAKSLPELQTEDDINCKNRTSLVNDKMEVEVDTSSMLTNTELMKMSSKHGVDTSPEAISKGKSLQDVNDNFPKSCSKDEVISHAEVSCESNRTIVNDNFVPGQHQPKIVVSDEMHLDKVTIMKEADNLVKGGKDKEKFNVHSNVPTPDLHSSLRIPKNQGNEAERSLSNSYGDSLKLQSKAKLRKYSGSGPRALHSNKSDSFNPKLVEAKDANAVSASAAHTRSSKDKKTVAAPSSSLESSQSLLPKSRRGNRHLSDVEIKKVSGTNDNGEVVNSSKPKKSLLATLGNIFKDDSDGSSDVEDGVEDSDNSTGTPSDNSSSYYSDGDSTAQQNESHSTKRKGSARRNITKSLYNVKLDTILRSSSRYKAAKLTASQSQLQDTESQPVEFVPDSQGNLQS